MDFAELAEDIAHEAEQALFLARQIKQIDERVANLYADADPAGIVASAPGVGAMISAVIAGRIGDRHHESAICHLATHLVTRIAACMRTGQPYALRDVDDTPITEAEGRAIVKARYKIDPRRRENVRYQRMRERRKHAAGQESQESRCAPTGRPAKTKPTSRQVA